MSGEIRTITAIPYDKIPGVYVNQPDETQSAEPKSPSPAKLVIVDCNAGTVHNQAPPKMALRDIAYCTGPDLAPSRSAASEEYGLDGIMFVPGSFGSIGAGDSSELRGDAEMPLDYLMAPEIGSGLPITKLF